MKLHTTKCRTICNKRYIRTIERANGKNDYNVKYSNNFHHQNDVKWTEHLK